MHPASPGHDTPLGTLPPPLLMSEEGSFANLTITKRLPAIVQQVIADNEFPPDVVGNLRELRNELPGGTPRPLDDDGPDLEGWADYLEPYLGQRWLEMPWYLGEMYFYRRILEATGYFSPGRWYLVDPYSPQKRKALTAALPVIRRLSARANALVSGEPGYNREGFICLTHFALWANRMDLSLWSAETTGREINRLEVEEEQARILADDTNALADRIAGLRAAPLHFIADNSGFELLSDLLLADHLLATGAAGTVSVHLKAHPIYVSDAMIQDVTNLILRLAADSDEEPQRLAARLQAHLDAGTLHLHDHAFWTTPLVFWDMPEALREELRVAMLVFVKGDVNYRRLVGDRHWPFKTPLQDIVQHFPAPLAALRTIKSELVVGLRPGQAQTTARRDPHWLTDGRWGVIQFVS